MSAEDNIYNCYLLEIENLLSTEDSTTFSQNTFLFTFVIFNLALNCLHVSFFCVLLLILLIYKTWHFWVAKLHIHSLFVTAKKKQKIDWMNQKYYMYNQTWLFFHFGNILSNIYILPLLHRPISNPVSHTHTWMLK